ncbi:MAG: hypothetical protein R3E65_08200 [Steroidobacteraceae bacterium]
MIDEAWIDFLGVTTDPDDTEPFEPGSVHDALFLPWFLHRWVPEELDALSPTAPVGQSPTAAYLRQEGSRADPLLRRYLEACVATPFSFFEVLEVQPGAWIRVRDMLNERETTVFEQSGSRTIQVSEILYAQIVVVDGLGLLEACPPYSLPHQFKLQVIDLREELARPDPADIDPARAEAAQEFVVRMVYLDALESMFSRDLPTLQNTDGDPLIPMRLVFEIDSMAAAIEALAALTAPIRGVVPPVEVERNAAGDPIRASFVWSRASKSKSAGPTILGEIDLRPKRLVCTVNSERRAEMFKEIVAKRPESTARFRLAEIQSIERQLAEGRGDSESDELNDAADELADSPEVQEKISEMLAEHYRTWPEIGLPALNGLTPIEAVRDRVGREKVTALLADIERSGSRMKPPLDPQIIARVRARLGLN